MYAGRAFRNVNRTSRRVRIGFPAWSRAAVLLSVVLIAAARAEAQPTVLDNRLALTVVAQRDVCRSHAPLSLRVTLKWAAAELIEGDLQLDWFVDTTRLGRGVIPDLALSESSLELSVVLPPVVLAFDDSVCSVQGRFVTAGAVYDLEVHDVALQPDWRRVLLTGVCQEETPIVRSRMELAAKEQQLELPRFLDLTSYFEQRFGNRELFVDYANVEPTDVPTDSLAMTAFDLFVVQPESVAKLKPAQLACLEEWVSAGGSLCVIVDGTVPASHVNWLNRLAGRDQLDTAYQTGVDGHVEPADAATNRVQPYRRGLGRAVVMLDQPDFESPSWRQVVLFLWKVRADRRRQADQGDKWATETAEEKDVQLINRGGGYLQPAIRTDFVDLQPKRTWGTLELEKLLLPDTVQGLPLWKVSLILLLFLLAIAPGDYLLLGWLKRRRWTWILFPSVSLLFTAFAMWTANQHLGKTSYERSITVVDVGEDGRAVRTSHFAMLYAAANRQVQTDQNASLMVPLDPDRSQGRRRRYEPQSPWSYEQAWTYVGRTPRRYSVVRDVQQWAPRLSRTTSFGSSADEEFAESINWDRLESAASHNVGGSHPFHAFRLTEDRMHLLSSEETEIPEQIVQLAATVTRRQPTGLFAYVSQLSPTGSGNWEDLTLLDPSDPGQEVLVAITSPSEGRYVICRRLNSSGGEQ